ncbi:MAG: DNA polymerase IV [Halobacteriaceae archaeon]
MGEGDSAADDPAGESAAGRSGTLPGVADSGDDRVVLHVDVDCFYAACERLREPELEGEPVVVGMGYEDGEDTGAVATASYEAREYGVESAQAISTALDRLPRKAEHPDDPDAGYYRPVDMEYYRSVAADVKAVLRDHADVVREVSVDEAYLDATERTGWEVVDGRPLAEGFARHVKAAVEREAGVTPSVGVAPDVSTAKVASDHDKPDGLVVVPPDEVREFLAPLPADAINGVGPVRAAALAEMGIETVGDVAAADPATLVDRFGEHGRELHRRARGEDPRPVEPRDDPKSLSRESSFGEAVEATGPKRERVRELAADVARRAEREGALYRTVGIKVVTPPFDVNTRAESLPGHVRDADLVESVALDLLGEFAAEPVRKLGVRVQGLSFADAEQSDLGGWAGEGEGPSHGDDGPADGTGRRRSRTRTGQSSLSEF